MSTADSISIAPIRTPSLGDTSYIVSDGSVAIVVDPQRDIDRFEGPIERLGVGLSAVLETHVHNDYVSGGPELARRTGARMIVPAAAAPSCSGSRRSRPTRSTRSATATSPSSSWRPPASR